MLNAITDTFLIDSVFPNRRSIGVLFDTVHRSQDAFEGFEAIRNYFPNKTDVVIFSQCYNPPIMLPPVALYHMKSLNNFKGSIVSTSLLCISDSLRIHSIDKKIWYIYNLGECSLYSNSDLVHLLEDPNVIKICRCERYKKWCDNINPNNDVLDDIMPSLDINKVEEIIYG